jgi:hypothetical protein
MADVRKDFWIRETGTGQLVAQLHDRYYYYYYLHPAKLLPNVAVHASVDLFTQVPLPQRSEVLILLVLRPPFRTDGLFYWTCPLYGYVAARTTTSSAFLDVVSWVRILLGRVDVCVVLLFMYCVGVEALRRRLAGSPTEYLSHRGCHRPSRPQRTARMFATLTLFSPLPPS